MTGSARALSITTPGVQRWRDEAIEGEFLWASGYAPPLPMHHHPTLQVGLIRCGVLDIDAGSGAEATVRAPSLVIVPPRVPHRVAGRPGTPVEYAQVELREDRNPFVDWVWCHKRAVVVVTDGAACHAFVELLECSNEEHRDVERVRRLDHLADCVKRAQVSELLATARDPVVDRVLRRLEHVTDRSVPLSEIVEAAGTSRSTLLRRFREKLGSTPHDYHVSVRRNAALDLIDRGYSIVEASIETGFHDQSHFARHARSILAMAPGLWRRRRRVRRG